MATISAIEAHHDYTILNINTKLLEDVGLVGTTLRSKSVEEAIAFITRRIPRLITVLVQPTASGFYTLPSGWSFISPRSRLVSIEFPIDQNPSSYFSLRRYPVQIVRRESSQVMAITPNPGGPFRLTFTASYSGTLTEMDISLEPIVGKHAAAITAKSLAAYYANTTGNNVDAVNYRTKSQEWREAGDAIEAKVNDELRQIEWSNLYDSDGDTLTGGIGWRG